MALGKPCLILASKTDIPDHHMTAANILEGLEIKQFED